LTITANGNRLPEVVLQAIEELSVSQGGKGFTYHQTLGKVQDVFKNDRSDASTEGSHELRTNILNYWNSLLRCGVIGFGTPNHWATDTFHLTKTGQKTLEQLGRDPINPDGYMAHIKACGTLDAVSESYVKEALHTYQTGCYKATAVMVGIAAEGMILHLRDILVDRFRVARKSVPSHLAEWRIKTVCDAIERLLVANQSHMPTGLSSEFDIYWSGFTSHIRAIRNKSGHPNSVDPVTAELVHSAMLSFPDFTKLVKAIEKWATSHHF